VPRGDPASGTFATLSRSGATPALHCLRVACNPNAILEACDKEKKRERPVSTSSRRKHQRPRRFAALALGVTFLAGLTGCLAPQNVTADRQYFRFELRGFPEGATCNADRTRGDVRSGISAFGRPFVKVTGFAQEARVFCDLADGRRLVTGLNTSLLQNPSYYGIELHARPNGRAGGVFSTTSGVRQLNGTLPGAFVFVN